MRQIQFRKQLPQYRSSTKFTKRKSDTEILRRNIYLEMVCIIESREELEKAINNAGDKLVVIDFYANWCGPCKIISPKLEELSNQYADKAVVLKVNVDDNDEIALDYNVSSMPTFVFIKSHKIIDVLVGGNPDKLTKNMEKYVNSIIASVSGAVDSSSEDIVLDEIASTPQTVSVQSAESEPVHNSSTIVDTAECTTEPSPSPPEQTSTQRPDPAPKPSRNTASSQTLTK